MSVVVPTKNSARTIENCITSILEQTYSNIETIVVDSKSTDGTVEIAERFGCKVIFTDWKLLGARYQGLMAASGDYITMIDSDQVLQKDAIQRSVNLTEDYDMLCLEEKAYKPKSLIEELFEADRKLIHNELDLQLDPIEGTLLARFYKRDILQGAFRAISESLFPFVIAHDHAIIYYEAWKLSTRVGIVPHAIWHNEPTTLIELWRKNFIYGKSTKKLLDSGSYNDFLKKKTRLRKTRSRKISKDKLLSSLLLILKAPPYLVGLYL